MYNDAGVLGIGYIEYWEREPKDTIDLCMKILRKQIDTMNSQIAMAYYQSNLTSVGFNSPNKFPKKPFKINDETDVKKKEERLQALADKLKEIKGESK